VTLTEAQCAQLAALEGRPINLDDLPEAPAENWHRAFRPRKEAISLRLDMDLLAWLRQRGPHYQTEINRILRERMQAEGGSR
jgi:uncharacterized protein (DUF4415 family)